MRQVPLHRLSQMAFYIMGYLLLLEWLYPLKAITDIDNVYVFYIFLVLPFTLRFLKVKTALKIMVLVVYVFWANHFLYYGAFSFFNIQWLFAFAADFMQSVVSLFQFDVDSMAYSFQTSLLFLLLWVMTYLIHYWVMVQRSIFLFFLLSVLYVTILDTFTPYNGDMAIVRLFIIGILLLGNLTFYRLIQNENLFISQKQYGIWLLPLIVMIAISSILGFASPKLPAQWPDPVPFFISYSEKHKSKETSSVNKVGYGEDDSTLGGDFIGDDTTVFTAKVSEKHYWKVETKDVYTGKGWGSTADSRIEPFNNGEEVPENCCSDNVQKSDLLIDEVDVKLPYVHIPYAEPMSESSIISLDSERGEDVSYLYTQMNNKIVSVNEEGKRIKLDRYKTVYRMPVFDVAKLREVKGMPKDELFYTYTKLPDVLIPQEVRSRLQQLAESITKDKTNWYDKAKAIENYFDRPEFVYDHENIPYPRVNQDFVEQFLFETKRGYCDHFSTSMAVLLRTIGIPTRWAKGYTEGEYKKYEDGKIIYEITNNNAHSWVEVYFPNTGWVPFEPTKGYTNPISFEDSQNVSTDTNTPEQEKEETKKPEPKEKEQVITKEETSFSDKVKAVVDRWSDNWPVIMASIGAIVVLVIALIASRRKWLPYLWFWFFRRKDTEEETFVKAYAVLLKQLQRSGLKRMQDQTLREYAIYVDSMYESSEMSELTFYYERIVYRGENPVENWQKAKMLWKIVMKKTIT
ncbi:transglutaminase domain-containing protein [Bacillus sp. JJ722]|uniref:transglutaminase family protein n=1 Tax=Bacillus sp. JJ722 TaxID=3122973 RepID=UPI002FFE010C